MTRKGRTLLVINFVVDADDPVLGFATRWLEALRPHVDRLVVLTGQVGEVPDTLDAEIISTNWVPGQNLRNVFRFERELLKTLRRFRPDAVFSHMAAPQAVLAAPWIRLMRRRHVLWYTHNHVSLALRIARYFVSAITTAAPETCRVAGSKVHVLGHGIDLQRFSRICREYSRLEIAGHWGRCDPIKRLDYLASVVEGFATTSQPRIRLSVVGRPSNAAAENWWLNTLGNPSEHNETEIIWRPAVKHDLLADTAADFDVFVHACMSGLDKAPLEAAALGIPVLSENESVRQTLGAPPCPPEIAEQLQWYLSQSVEERSSFAERQHAAVVEHHSLPRLGSRLIDLLFGVTP
jgi:glycosyltransferase involved in cell wall biosynthesis